MYDYLIVGSGLFGAVFAHEMKGQGEYTGAHVSACPENGNRHSG